jgi:hypothetical protein
MHWVNILKEVVFSGLAVQGKPFPPTLGGMGTSSVKGLECEVLGIHNFIMQVGERGWNVVWVLDSV